MKGLLLAGGRGTRLRPLTHTKNKHLLPIGNEPMIFRVIKDMIEAGITDIIVNINSGDTSIREAIESQSWDANFSYIEQREANGMMYPILLAEKLLKGEEFILHGGDNILSGGLKKYISKFANSTSDALILTAKVEHPERFSVYKVEGSKALQVVEKPKEYIGNLAGTAIYIYRGEAIFKAMHKVKPIDPEGKGRAEYFPPPAHQWMIDRGYDVRVAEVTGWWKDTGKPNDLILANRLVLETRKSYKRLGKVENSELEGDNIEVAEGAQIINSKIRGPVSIGKNVVVENSYVGPYTSIGDGSRIHNAQIENSIVMGNAHVHDLTARLDNCLIGWETDVTEKEELPRSTSLFIGDNSIVNL